MNVLIKYAKKLVASFDANQRQICKDGAREFMQTYFGWLLKWIPDGLEKRLIDSKVDESIDAILDN